MGGFTGYTNALKQHLLEAVEVMDPFHAVWFAGAALDGTLRRVQQETLGHRGSAGDLLYAIWRRLPRREAVSTARSLLEAGGFR